MPRELKAIIAEIVEENPPLNETAAEHLLKLRYPTEKFHIRSFLGNAKNWRGHVARRIKAELREYLK